jgi:hypothetical protein
MAPFVHVQERPVIVLGNHKAGTSVVAGLLGSLTAQSTALELRKELKHDRYRAVHEGRLPFARLIARNKVDFSRAIIKENHFSTMPGQIMAQFPRSPIIMIVREPRDNIRSLLNRLGVPGNLESIPPKLWRTVPDVWKLVLDGRWLGLDSENYIEQQALRWNLIVDHHLANRDRWVLQRYEDFQADKLTELGRLAGAVGLLPVRDITHALDFQFQPAGDRSVSWESFFGEENLARIEQICAANMERLGYPLSRDRRGVQPLDPDLSATAKNPGPISA